MADGWAQQSRPFNLYHGDREFRGAVLIVHGEPAIGADPMNGLRVYSVHTDIDATLGYDATREALAEPTLPATPTPKPLMGNPL
jgi:hypothetical protein